MSLLSPVCCCSTGMEVEVLLDALNDPSGPPSEIPVRPLTGTKPGCIYAEPGSHKRPFPKRHAVPYDRWRNSGGKRGATVINGQRTVFVRRYGNVCFLLSWSNLRR